jgi:hypothetical protein
MYNIGIPSDTHNDIARFEVTVNEVARMGVLQVAELGAVDVSLPVVVTEVEFTHQLPSQKQHSLDYELEIAANKEVLKGQAEAVDRHHIKARFHTKPMDMRDTSPSLKLCIDIELVA